MLLFINFQVTTDTFVVSPTPRRVLLLSLAATTSERGFGIAKEYRTTTTKTEYKWKKSAKKSKRKKKKKKKRGRMGSQCGPGNMPQTLFKEPISRLLSWRFYSGPRITDSSSPGRSFNVFNFRSVDTVHWIIWLSVVNFQNVENRLINA